MKNFFYRGAISWLAVALPGIALIIGGSLTASNAARAESAVSLSIGQTQHIHFDSQKRSSSTGYWVNRGDGLFLWAKGEQPLVDWYIKTNPAGYNRWYLGPFDLLRRVPDAPFFRLVAYIDDGSMPKRADYFVVPLVFDSHWSYWRCQPHVLVAKKSGWLVLFVNDVDFAYWNNKGCVHAFVKRLR
jgi:hypothetical protein